MLTADEYKAMLKKSLSTRRFTHCVNVSKEAVKLAKIYGADKDKAKIAGLLHDVTKEMPFEKQLVIMHNGGLALTEDELISTKLWHAMSGAIYVRDILLIDDEDIYNAIRYHTTGRAGMSLLEKIIFTADFTSAERSYNGVEVMREKSYKNLDDAVLYGVSFTISDISKKCQPLHPDALKLYNEIVYSKYKKDIKSNK